MAGRSIYWHDGMFMWPHHMQQEERFRAGELALHNRWNVHHYWGLRSIDVDLQALKNHQLVIHNLRARMRDGTMISAPEDCPLPALDLKEALAEQDPVMVHLAVPRLKENQPNALEPAAATEERPQAPTPDTRYLVSSADIYDENSGSDTQAIQVQALNVRLLLDTQEMAGYETLPILRVQKSPGNDTQTQLDDSYIPPLIACDAWHFLSHKMLQDRFHLLSSRMANLADRIVTRGISFDTHNPGDDVLLGKLAALNEACTTLNALVFAEGIHPLQAYLELCRIVGQRAIYKDTRRVPELPHYDHDDLAFCFQQVLRELDDEEGEQQVEERRFVGEKKRMQVALERSWLEPVWQLYVGVKSDLAAKDLIPLFTKAGPLELKIGSAERVDEFYDRGMPGLEFKSADHPPRVLRPGLTYFQVIRESRPEEWQNLQKSLKLAIRFNEKRVATNPDGTIQGLTALRTQPGKGLAATTLEFYLVLLRQQAT